jgi:hypothetical protein
MTERASDLLTVLTASRDKTPAPARLAALARRVGRLAPSHRDPERFHEDKSEIVAELHRLAREARRG